MVIPRVLSRGSSIIAQKAHFSAILEAAPSIPAVIYNSPHYGFETRADLFLNYVINILTLSALKSLVVKQQCVMRLNLLPPKMIA